MIYCCGASMIGKIGTIVRKQVSVHQVPVLYCPVCQKRHVHPAVKEQFELVVEYAIEDRVKETTLYDRIDPKMLKKWKESSFSFEEDDNQESILREQIDLALDLLRICKPDYDWADLLKIRLKVLSEKLRNLEISKENSC
ncbi:hypothetical protein SAMN04487866_10253 [Thermoactinomyces sp. DSM 45891]|uniref:hypothetical protein n=1 Tax=Thermoactinomyces sp. DSM 45891 TaxID=1761907 RepID=UPI00091F4868|nr:hypothetical protein [Thermoactinomyces sp. DSM 45891]SFX18358.1 hypothetical protein SAMN04487866_10253 [Thermoactinomyces sp. DSM 45891]